MKHPLLPLAALALAASLPGSMQAQNKAYLTQVLEYCPAPGQFVHELPAYEEGDTAERMAQKCLDNLYNESLVSLGGYGGYMTVSFDHPVVNVPGQKDLLILGNANRYGTSAEPGIVLVAMDTNANGLPDDTWYELAGSEYANPATLHGYEITYTRPDRPDQDVVWTDNQGGQGVVKYMGSTYGHAHAHFPAWTDQPTLTFRGSRLPDNGAWDETMGMWVMRPWDYGYVDNQWTDEGSQFDLDWAVCADGTPANLPYVDFVRIYTAVNQQVAAGVGELSTEVADVQDLHPEAAASIGRPAGGTPALALQGRTLDVRCPAPTEIRIYRTDGQTVAHWHHPGGHGQTALTLTPGCYVAEAAGQRIKLLVR